MPAKKVTINLEAQTASFIDGMDKSGKSLDRFGRQADEAGAFLERFKKGFELATGFEGLHTVVDSIKEGLDQVKDAFEEVGDIGRNAMKLGISVEDMSRFQHAANSAHVDISALTTGMDFLNRQIGLIANGDKGAAQAASALKQLGLDARELEGLDPAETFKRVSEALAGMTDHYQKAAIVQQLLSRGGRELIPLMEHLNGLMAGSDDIGFTRTAEDVENVEQGERALAEATDTLKGALMDLASSHAVNDQLAAWDQGIKNIDDDIKALNDPTGMKQFLQDAHELANVSRKLADARNAAAAGSLEGRIAAQKQVVDLDKQELALATRMKVLADNNPNGNTHISEAWIHPFLDQVTTDQRSLTSDEHANDAVKNADAQTQAIMDSMAKRADSIAASLAPLRQKLDDVGKTDAAKELEKVDAAMAKLGVTDGAAHAMAAKLVEDLDKATVAAKNNARAMDEITLLKKEIANETAGEHFQGDADPKLLNQIHDLEKSLKSAKDHQSNVAEGKRLWEESETAVQKYADALKEVKKLEDDSAVSAARGAQIKQHLADQYQKSLGGKDEKADKREKDRQAPLIERQFTFAMGAVQKDNPSKQILDLHQRVFAGWETYFHDLWQQATNAPTPVVFDITATT